MRRGDYAMPFARVLRNAWCGAHGWSLERGRGIADWNGRPSSPPRGSKNCRSGQSRLEVLSQVGKELSGRVFLDRVTRRIHPDELGVRDPCVQELGELRWQQTVFAPPDDPSWHGYVAQQVLELFCLCLFGLAVLAVERGLAVRSPPGCDVRVKD